MSLRGLLIGFLLFIFGIKYGVNYLESDRFQKYANARKAPWTCQVEGLMGHFYMTTSDYDRAVLHFERILKRCPKTKMCESAEFELARCYEGQGNPQKAAQQYLSYVEKYPHTRRARTAAGAADILRGGGG